MAVSSSTYTVFLIFLAILTSSLLYINLDLPGFSAPLKPKYPPGVPEKFDTDGNAQRFAGNAIISYLPNSSDVHGRLLSFYDQLRQSKNSHLYALLPPSSWHMTILGGALDSRQPGYWPTNLAMDASLDDCNSLFVDELSTFDLQTILPLRLLVTGLTPTGLGLHVEPQAADDTSLRTLRDRLASVLQIRYPDHDVFAFHISIAYFLRYLTGEQEDEIRREFTDSFKDLPMYLELDAPVLCVFENMLAYTPLLTLKNIGS